MQGNDWGTFDLGAYLADMVGVLEDDWEVRGELINCVNGMVDARELKLLPHDPKFGSRTQVPCRFIPDETRYSAPPLWKQTLKEIFPEPDGVGFDKVDLLWQYFGYVLLPDCRYEASLWLLGTGQNGKGTITETLQEVLGEDNVSNLQISELKDPRFSTYHLQHKMLNLSTETSGRDPLSTEIFKKIVSGERLTAERKYGQKYEFVPRVKIVIGLNDMPVIPDKTEGFGRRVKLIRCDQKFKEGDNRDPDRKANLKKKRELDGIFTWMVSGLTALLANKGFKTGARIKEDTEVFLDGLNPMKEFFKEECEFDPEYSEEGQKLFDRHKSWCKENNQRDFAKIRFNNELLKEPGVRKKLDSYTRRVAFSGIRLKP